MTLLLRNEDILGLMKLEQYIHLVEAGYRELGLGYATNIPRQSLWVTGGEGGTSAGGHLRSDASGSFEFKGALLDNFGFAGLNVYTTGVGSGLNTYMFLFDTTNGEMIAIMDVIYYDWLKTAAVSAVATKYLAPAECSKAAIFGTGRHARTQLHGVCAVRPLKEIRAYSRNSRNRQTFCVEMTKELGIPVIPVSSPLDAIKDVDLIITITKSPKPVFDGRLLQERPIHINAMGAHHPWVREIDETVVINSHIIVDEKKQALLEQGEILIPIAEGRMNKTQVHGDLADVIVGRVPGRTEDTPWTLFLSGGTGIEDVIVTGHLYKLALERGVGVEISFDQSLEHKLVV